jgi:tetratricopeptide (TPR) repeat protein
MRKICLAILLVPALALAQPRSANDWYKEGYNQFTLANFDKAIDAFKRAFALETDENKQAVYIYNIAQAYRQSNDCGKAQFFYKRFIAIKSTEGVKPMTPAERKTVEDFIRDLEPCAQQAASLGKRPPENLQSDGSTADKSDKTAADGGRKEPRKDKEKDVAVARHDGDGTGEEDNGDTGAKAELSAAPHVISAWVSGGGTKISAGDVGVPVQATFALVAGYPIPVTPELTIHVGGAFTFTPVPFTVQATSTTPEQSKTGQMFAAMANAGASYELVPNLFARGDLGVGALLFNASESQFTDMKPTSGALTMFHLRVAASVDYAITPNILISATPFAFAYSPPKEGLTKSISALTEIDFMIGLGFRM